MLLTLNMMASMFMQWSLAQMIKKMSSNGTNHAMAVAHR